MIAKQKLTRNRHGRPVEQRWVSGAYDCNRKIGMLALVDDRSAETLLPIISSWCLEGTTIHSDGWPAYSRLGEMGFDHRVVVHEQYYVDPETGVHTNNVENYWQRCKRKFKRMYGTKSSLLPSYLDEFMWNERFGRTFSDRSNNTLLCFKENHFD